MAEGFESSNRDWEVVGKVKSKMFVNMNEAMKVLDTRSDITLVSREFMTRNGSKSC